MNGDAAGVAPFHVLDHSVVDVVRLGVPEGAGMLVRLHLAGANGDQQGVVVDLPSVARVHHLLVGLHPSQCVLGPLGSAVGRNALQRVAVRRAEGERLSHGERPIDELVVRSDQLNLNRVAKQPAQAEQTLDGCDAAATDDYAEIGHERTVRRRTRPAIGANTPAGRGIAAGRSADYY